MKKDIIVLMGGQGVGKGTFAKLLMRGHDFHHIETGALFRAMPADSAIGRLIARGELVPDAELFKLIASKITNDTDIILDGFPGKMADPKLCRQIQYSRSVFGCPRRCHDCSH